MLASVQGFEDASGEAPPHRYSAGESHIVKTP